LSLADSFVRGTMRLFDTVIEQVQAKGERITIQRRLVIEALCNGQGHLSIGAIQHYSRTAYPASALQDTTIYRILQWLKDMQLVSQTDMGTVGIVYELLVKPHHHLICLACGTVADLDDGYLTLLRDRLSAEFGFEARIDHMAIYGLCQTCKAANTYQLTG
jgi:Fur family ferric uptake transcriptional regulator